MSLTVKMPNCMSSPLLVESTTISPWPTRPAPRLCPAERVSRAQGIPVCTSGAPNTRSSYFATLRRTTPMRPGRSGNGAVAAGPAGESGLALSGRGSGFEAVVSSTGEFSGDGRVGGRNRPPGQGGDRDVAAPRPGAGEGGGAGGRPGWVVVGEPPKSPRCPRRPAQPGVLSPPLARLRPPRGRELRVLG